jgi:hypothetical protein
MSTLQPTGRAKLFFDEVVLKVNPKASLKAKSTSVLQRALGFAFKNIVPFNPLYMQQYITVVGDTIWMPEKDLGEGALFQTLVHENIHFKQKKKYGNALFSFLYLSPLTVGLVGLVLALAFHSWIVALSALVLLAPLPAYFRFSWEVEAYRTSLILANHSASTSNYRGIDLVAIERNRQLTAWVVSQLAGKFYYFAWPFKKHVETVLNDAGKSNDPIYADLHAFLSQNP